MLIVAFAMRISFRSLSTEEAIAFSLENWPPSSDIVTKEGFPWPGFPLSL